jgi:hypothetical protein
MVEPGLGTRDARRQKVNKRVLLGIIILVLFGCVEVSAVISLPNAPVRRAHKRRHTAVALVLGGQPIVKRGGRKLPVRVGPGAELRPGDIYKRKKSEGIVIIGPNLQKLDASSGEHRIYNPRKPRLMSRDQYQVFVPRGGESGGVGPILISPRKTILLNPRPPIRWVAVPGTTRYVVRLIIGGNEWESEQTPACEIAYPDRWPAVDEETRRCEIAYPDNWPALPSEKTCTISVRADNSSRDSSEQDQGFSLLSAQEVEGVRKLQQQIDRLPLSDAQKKFLTAYVYANWNPATDRNLNVEAIELLESLSSTPSELHPAAFRLLGDLYLKIGVLRFAEKAYLIALKAVSSNDLEARAAVLNGLSRVYNRLVNHEKAIQYSERSLRLYSKLQNTRMIRETRKFLNICKSSQRSGNKVRLNDPK